MKFSFLFTSNWIKHFNTNYFCIQALPLDSFWLCIWLVCPKGLEDASAKRYYYISILAMDSWIRLSCVDCLCVPKGMKMCMCNIYKKIVIA